MINFYLSIMRYFIQEVHLRTCLISKILFVNSSNLFLCFISSGRLVTPSKRHQSAIIMPLSRNYYAIYQNQGYSAPFICHHLDIISPFQCNYSATNTQFLRHLFRSILFQEDNNIDISVNTQYYNGNVIIIFDNNKLA